MTFELRDLTPEKARYFYDKTIGSQLKRTEKEAIMIALLRDPNTDTSIIKAIIERKRQSMRKAFFSAFTPIGNMPLDQDTYKRFMAAASDHFALEPAAYTLTFRKPLPESGADNRFIMFGHEIWLRQVFGQAIPVLNVEIMKRFMHDESNVKVFPDKLWERIMEGQNPRRVRLPVDVYGFAGGQTFMVGVPALSCESPLGGAVSYIETAMCRYFITIIQATKARLMKVATPRDAEFGLRAAYSLLLSIVTQLARFVGSGGTAKLTSNDMAHFLFPELADAIGTIGHELVCAWQELDKSLASAEFDGMDAVVTTMKQASLLADLVDALSIGMENVIKVMKKHPDARVGARVDSGDIKKQCVLFYRQFKAAGKETRTIVFEDEVTPEMVKEVYDYFRQETGVEPTMLFPGAGGYWYKMHRDHVSAAFKRTATNDNPNVKFSNSPGKESLGGHIRVFERGSKLLIADKSESIDGLPLYQHLVKKGVIAYRESFQTQAQRSDATWDRYDGVELSPKIAYFKDTYNAKRTAEIADARERLIAEGFDWLQEAA